MLLETPYPAPVVVSEILSTGPVDVIAAAVFCRLKREPVVIVVVDSVSAVCVVRLFQFQVCAYSVLSIVWLAAAAVMSLSGTLVATPQAVPVVCTLPLASACRQSPEVNEPVTVAKSVVLPLTVPTAGAAMAPPPITGMFAVSAAEEAIAELLLAYRTPPLVNDAG